jgi:hypothetical protein
LSDSWFRRLVALFLHAPGLWLIYREPLPKELRRPNLVAAGATVIVMAATAWLLPPPWGWPRGVLSAWAAGHLAWGAFLMRHAPRSGSTKTPGPSTSKP